MDGLNVSEYFIRQFVSTPLGERFTAEEQITGAAEHGGLQIIVYPMKHDLYVERFGQKAEAGADTLNMQVCDLMLWEPAAADIGLAPSGLMGQKIYEDKYGIDARDQENGFRCFIHLTNSAQYMAITGHQPPHQLPTAKKFTDASLPWFEYYSDGEALACADTIGKLISVAAKVTGKRKAPLPDNDPVQPKTVKIISSGNMVRDGER